MGLTRTFNSQQTLRLFKDWGFVEDANPSRSAGGHRWFRYLDQSGKRVAISGSGRKHGTPEVSYRKAAEIVGVTLAEFLDGPVRYAETNGLNAKKIKQSSKPLMDLTLEGDLPLVSVPQMDPMRMRVVSATDHTATPPIPTHTSTSTLTMEAPVMTTKTENGSAPKFPDLPNLPQIREDILTALSMAEQPITGGLLRGVVGIEQHPYHVLTDALDLLVHQGKVVKAFKQAKRDGSRPFAVYSLAGATDKPVSPPTPRAAPKPTSRPPQPNQHTHGFLTTEQVLAVMAQYREQGIASVTVAEIAVKVERSPGTVHRTLRELIDSHQIYKRAASSTERVTAPGGAGRPPTLYATTQPVPARKRKSVQPTKDYFAAHATHLTKAEAQVEAEEVDGLEMESSQVIEEKFSEDSMTLYKEMEAAHIAEAHQPPAAPVTTTTVTHPEGTLIFTLLRTLSTGGYVVEDGDGAVYTVKPL